ncbi:hypothetical protein [Nocardia paucivorans]|uniref:hypothetical protein n=1 Tax=Nocardia paucivorans TaxID=114259 RepID=UPI0002E5FAA5|nr:hypothetical protein [Nocardia paucivorans]
MTNDIDTELAAITSGYARLGQRLDRIDAELARLEDRQRRREQRDREQQYWRRVQRLECSRDHAGRGVGRDR